MGKEPPGNAEEGDGVCGTHFMQSETSSGTCVFPAVVSSLWHVLWL